MLLAVDSPCCYLNLRTGSRIQTSRFLRPAVLLCAYSNRPRNGGFVNIQANRPNNPTHGTALHVGSSEPDVLRPPTQPTTLRTATVLQY